MRKPVRVMLFMFLAGLLAATPTGCNKGQEGTQATKSGKAKPAEGAKLEIPAPQTITDSSILALLQVRDPNQLVNRLAAWVGQVQPSITSDTLRQHLAADGVTLEDLRPGQSAAAFVLAPPRAEQSPAGAILVPAAADSQIVKTLSQKRSDNKVTAADQYTMISQGVAPGADEQTARKLAPLAAAKPAPDLQLYLNTSSTMAIYGPRLQAMSNALPGLAAMAMSQQPGGARVMSLLPVMQAGITAMLDFLGQSQYMSLGADLEPQMLELSMIAKGQPGTTLEKVLQPKPVSAPDLAGYLDPNAVVRAQQTVRDLKGFLDIYLKYVEIAMGQGRQAEMARLREDLKDAGKVGKVTTATGFNTTPEGKIVYEFVTVCDNNDAYMDLVRTKFVRLLNEGIVHDFYRGMGIEFNAKEDAQTRKAAGAEVHRFTLTVTPGPALPPQERARLEKMFAGGVVIEMAKVGGNIVITMGEPIEALAGRVAGGKTGPGLQAMKSWPAGGILYLDLNFAALVRQAKQSMPPEQASRVPDLKPDAPPVIVACYHADGLAWYRMGIPKGLIGSFKTGAGTGPSSAGATAPTTTTTVR